MQSFNHTNLTTYDVPGLTEFFCRLFGFKLTHNRGTKLAVLVNQEGFLLTLMFDKGMTPEQGYPGIFHVGFLQPTPEAVDTIHAEFQSQNYQPPAPAKLERGGPPAYGFYYKAPGGVLVEVSTMNLIEGA